MLINAMITAIRASQNSVLTTVAATNTITMAPISTSTARSMFPRYVAVRWDGQPAVTGASSAPGLHRSAAEIIVFQSYRSESSQQIGLNWPTGYAHLAGLAADR